MYNFGSQPDKSWGIVYVLLAMTVMPNQPILLHVIEVNDSPGKTGTRLHTIHSYYSLVAIQKTKVSKKITEIESSVLKLKPRSHSAGMAAVHPGGGQPVYPAEPGHFS